MILTTEARIILACKLLGAVQESIARAGGRYSGSMAPNLTSVVDALTLPAAVVAPYTIAPRFRVKPHETAALAASWAGLAVEQVAPAAHEPLFLFRTWSGSYVEPGRVHLALLGWARHLCGRALKWLHRHRGAYSGWDRE